MRTLKGILFFVFSFSAISAQAYFFNFWSDDTPTKEVIEINYWKMRSVSGNIITMDNGTKWAIALDQAKLYETVKQDLPELYKSSTIGDEPTASTEVTLVKNHQNIVVFSDITAKHLFFCVLNELPQDSFPTIVKIDSNGYFIELSDGTEWSIPWLGSWTTMKWSVGECVAAVKTIQGLEHNFSLINLDELSALDDTDIVLRAIQMQWKE